MSPALVIRDSERDRSFEAERFPLSVGGHGADVTLPAIPDDETVAHLGLDDGALFIQPLHGDTRVYCNGAPVSTSQWLRHGDSVKIDGFGWMVAIVDRVYVLVASDSDRGHETAPPIAAPGPRRRRAAAAPAVITPIEYIPKAPSSLAKRRLWPKPIHVAEILVLILLSVGAWFVFTARSVTVEIDPPTDTVRLIRGFPVLELGDRYMARPGRYTLVAELDGYRRLEIPVEVSRDSRQTLRFTLDPLPGELSVTTGSLEGAEVIIDGNRVGSTPIHSIELDAGDHEVVIRAERHQVFTTGVTIAGRGQAQLLEATLVPAWAPVTIQSRPAGATVFLNEHRVGVTPVTVEIGAGSHRLALTLVRHKELRRTIEVTANQPQTLPVARLEPADGVLLLASSPAQATITVDGEFGGHTPRELRLEPDRDHVIRLSKPGHETRTEHIRLAAGERVERSPSLEVLMGEIEIISTPPNAEIVVDGEPQGLTGRTLSLTALTHKIEVRKEGYESFETELTAHPGLSQTIRVELRTPEQAAALPASITSPQGVELKLVNAGSFRMGASRREPGRRANESIRDVEITRPFYIAIREVTNREFREFNEAHRSGMVGNLSLETDHHPAVRVSWQDAARYCNWLSEQQGLPPVYVSRGGRMVARNPLPYGYRLPTEAEWAWTARYAGGEHSRKYPWGDALPIPDDAGNFGDRSAHSVLGGSLPDYDDGYPSTAPAGSFPANPLGLHNLGGNVSEWVHDVYSMHPPGAGTIELDPIGPKEGEYHVIRGASWMAEKLTELRLSYRDYGDEARPDVGFRIARSGS